MCGNRKAAPLLLSSFVARRYFFPGPSFITTLSFTLAPPEAMMMQPKMFALLSVVCNIYHGMVTFIPNDGEVALAAIC